METEQLTKIQPYTARPIRYVANFSPVDDWQIKLYWISWRSQEASQSLIELSKAVIKKRLESVTEEFTHYNTGFGIIHEGKDGTYVVVSYWIEENMLDHIVFKLDAEHPDGFTRLEPNSIVTCVWELEVMYFEKKTWISCVLKKSGGIQKYLESSFNTEV